MFWWLGSAASMRAVVLLALCALGDEHEGCVEDCISCARIDWLKEYAGHFALMSSLPCV